VDGWFNRIRKMAVIVSCAVRQIHVGAMYCTSTYLRWSRGGYFTGSLRPLQTSLQIKQ